MVNLDALEPLKGLLCAMPDIERTAGRIALKASARRKPLL